MKFNKILALFGLISIMFVAFLIVLSLRPGDTQVTEELFCGGFAGTQCPSGYECVTEGDYPDASGTCVK